jgi:hypothetical protein
MDHINVYFIVASWGLGENQCVNGHGLPLGSCMNHGFSGWEGSLDYILI